MAAVDINGRWSWLLLWTPAMVQPAEMATAVDDGYWLLRRPTRMAATVNAINGTTNKEERYRDC